MDGKKISKTEMDKLNPQNIQHITVYKGEKAIARFGEGGKEGVIEITTKSAKE